MKQLNNQSTTAARNLRMAVIAMLLALLLAPAALFAQTTTVGDYIVSGGTVEAINGHFYLHYNGYLLIQKSGNLTIKMKNPGTTSQTPIVVASGINNLDLTLEGVSVQVTQDGFAGLSFNYNTDGQPRNNTLTLVGENTLKGKVQAGVMLPNGTSLTITGNGTLNAHGDGACPGIGSYHGVDYRYYFGNLIIESGTVNAYGGGSTATDGYGGPGIGGTIPSSSQYGLVEIKGGRVTATGYRGSPGIGRSYTSNENVSCDVTISGGTVTAIAANHLNNDGQHAAAIGGAGSGGGTGSLSITGGSVRRINSGSTAANSREASVDKTYIPTRLVSDAAKNARITAASLPLAGYGMNDVYADADGIVHLWQPSGSNAASTMTAGSVVYSGTINVSNGSALLFPPGFTVVTDITDVRTDAPTGSSTLTATVEPSNASLQNIVWSVVTPGSTGATINGNTLNAPSIGTVTVRATIPTGKGTGGDFTKDFNITVTTGDPPPSTDLTITGGLYEVDWKYASNVFTILTQTPMTVSGTTNNKERIQIGDATIPEGFTANLTFKDLTITHNTANYSPVTAMRGGLNLTLSGNNVITSNSSERPAIGISGSNAYGILTIDGPGTLTAQGGTNAPGIGGSGTFFCGAVVIKGGTVNATGGSGGAGIGGANYYGGESFARGGTVTITGGMVNATGGTNGAGIGGASPATNLGTLAITGGSVRIASGTGGAAFESPRTNGAGTTVQLITLTVGSATANVNAPVTAGVINGVACAEIPNAANSVYGIKDVKTDGNSRVYFWLPAVAKTMNLTTNNRTYSGSFTNTATSGTLTIAPPAAISVSPSGNSAPLSGNIIIIFDREMNTGYGTVRLNGGTALTGGTWSDGNTVFTVPYSGLEYGTAYTVNISAFREATGTTAMANNNGNSFTTAAPPVLSAGSVNRTSDTAATIGFTTDKDGAAYYLVLNSGAAAPTAAEVRAGTYLADVLEGAVSGEAVTLTAGVKDIYVVVEDLFNLISDPLKIVANIPVAYTAVQVGGASGTVSSTGITVTFDKAVSGLTAGDITITNGTGDVTKGTLSGSGTTWTIGLTDVAAQGDVTVDIADFGDFIVTTTAQTVAVYKNLLPVTVITATAITGVTSPVADATPSTEINDEIGFTAVLSWNGDPATFDYATVYTATITLTAESGYTFSGDFANTAEISGFTVNTITPVWVSNDGTTLVFTVTFPATAAASTYYNVSIDTFEGGSVSSDKTSATEYETVTLTITPDAGYALNNISTSPALTLSGSGDTRTFTMPASDVTVSATFAKTQAQLDLEAVNAAKALIESMTGVTVAQETANTEAAVKIWLATQINALSGMSATGITVLASDITLSDFTEAVAGDASNLGGTDGGFTFVVSLQKGASTVTTAGISGTIIATPYYDPTGNSIVATNSDSSLRTWVINGTLHVSGLATGTTWAVYNLSGILIYKSTASSNEATVALPVCGVYIVISGNETMKVIY